MTISVDVEESRTSKDRWSMEIRTSNNGEAIESSPHGERVVILAKQCLGNA
jgi:hypothetical protein